MERGWGVHEAACASLAGDAYSAYSHQEKSNCPGIGKYLDLTDLQTVAGSVRLSPRVSSDACAVLKGFGGLIGSEG